MSEKNSGKIQHQSSQSKQEWRGPALAAACIMGGFAFMAYLMPPIMLWLGEYSLFAAASFAVLFVLAFFAVFWLRARSQK